MYRNGARSSKAELALGPQMSDKNHEKYLPTKIRIT